MQSKNFPKQAFLYLDGKNFKSKDPVVCLVDDPSNVEAGFRVGLYKFVGEVEIRGRVEYKLPGKNKWSRSAPFEREEVDDDED